MEYRVTELGDIEFKGTKSVAQFSRKSRDVCRDYAREFDQTGSDFEQIMRAFKRQHSWVRIDILVRARRVARNLRLAREAANTAAKECVAFHAQFRREFADILAAQQKRKKGKTVFNWKDT